MFEQLYVQQHKALPRSLIEDLGKVNVICGKNNSGKSTLLEAINDASNRRPGLKFDGKNLERLFNLSAEHLAINIVPLDGNSENKKVTTHIKDKEIVRHFLFTIFEKTISSQKIWFSDNLKELMNDLSHTYSNEDFLNELYTPFNIEGNSRAKRFIDSGAVHNFFNSALGKHSSILIPPKRQLESSSQVNITEDTSPQGVGVLNALFLAQSQLPGSTSRKTYDTISRAFSFITSEHRFYISLVEQNRLNLFFSHGESNNWIQAENCGLGLQDLLVILYYATHPAYQIVLIEEPENHFHPDMQHKLLHFLATESDKQFFLTSHSNVFLSSPYTDRVFFTKLINQSIKISDATSRALILQSLGYSVTDNLVSDLVILVEGPSDKPFIEEFLAKMGIFGKYEIKIWPLGGDIMADLDLSVFAQHYNIIAIVDKDPGSESIRRRFIENCQAYSIPVHRLERYSIENYYSLSALRTVFGPQIDETITEIKPDEKLETQIKLSTKKRSRNIAREMELSDIQGTDLGNFFETIRGKLSTA